jgi:hypothetical protein
MSHPFGHLASAGGDSRSDSGASSNQASAAALQPYTLSLTSGCRTFKLDVPTPNEGLFFEHQDAIDRVSLSDASSGDLRRRWVTAQLAKQRRHGSHDLGDGKAVAVGEPVARDEDVGDEVLEYEAFKNKFSLRFEWLQKFDGIYVLVENASQKYDRRTLRSALLDSGFVLGSVIDHDFDELAYDFQPYAVYEVLHRMAVTSDLILFCRGWTRLTVFLYPGNTSFSIARLCMTGT